MASLPRALAGVGLLAGEVAESIATGSFLPTLSLRASSSHFRNLDDALRTTYKLRYEDLPDELYVYTSGDTSQKILASGRIGRGGSVYLTTRKDLTPLQAQLELALSP